MIKVVLSAASIVLGLGLELAFAVDIGSGVEFNGYFRSGAGQNSKGGAMTQFVLPDADSQYRIGNEADTYGDFLFSKTAWQSPDGSKFKLYFQTTVYGTDLSENTTFLNGTNLSVSQLYVEGKEIPELRGASVWMGRRLYRREGIHILDMFYDNPSGTGGGIEGIQLFKGANLAYAFFRNNMGANSANTNSGASRHDLQVRDIPLYFGGSLDLFGRYINSDGKGDDPTKDLSHDGYQLAVQYTHLFKDLGTNKLYLAYGVGAGTGLGGNLGTGMAGRGSLENGNDVKVVRALDFFTFQLTRNFGGQLVAGYTHNMSDAGDLDWYTVGGRLSYAFTDHLKLVGDVGHDQTKPQGQDSRSLTKVTIAPTISLGRDFWARPELRLYYTYATWNKAAQTAAAAGSPLSRTGAFGSDTNGSTYGVQVEAWW